MPDAMVTARMPQAKKEAGAAVFKEIGTTASAAINQLYDYVLEKKALPFSKEQDRRTPLTKDQLQEALAWVDSIPRPGSSEFSNITLKEAKRRRMISKGLMDESDFA